MRSLRICKALSLLARKYLIFINSRPFYSCGMAGGVYTYYCKTYYFTILFHVIKLATMTYQDLIEINPKIMMGKPVVKGTRITVESILEELSAGRTMQDLEQAHPRLDRAAILAALAFAADSLKNDLFYSIAS